MTKSLYNQYIRCEKIVYTFLRVGGVYQFFKLLIYRYIPLMLRTKYLHIIGFCKYSYFMSYFCFMSYMDAIDFQNINIFYTSLINNIYTAVANTLIFLYPYKIPNAIRFLASLLLLGDLLFMTASVRIMPHITQINTYITFKKYGAEYDNYKSRKVITLCQSANKIIWVSTATRIIVIPAIHKNIVMSVSTFLELVISVLIKLMIQHKTIYYYFVIAPFVFYFAFMHLVQALVICINRVFVQKMYYFSLHSVLFIRHSVLLYVVILASKYL